MKRLLLLTLITSVQAQDAYFSGTAYNTRSGNVQIVTGFVNSLQSCNPAPQPSAPRLEKLKQVNAKLTASNARLNAEIEASDQLFELRRQTRLLEEIANK